MLKLIRCVLVLAATITALNACRYNEPMSDTSALTTPFVSSLAFISPQPTPTYATKPGFAALHGVLFLTNPMVTAPREDGIYLVRIDTEERGAMVVPAVNPETSLQADVDEVTGRFFFADVPQGLYALVAVTDNGQQISVRKFDTGEAAVIMIGEEDLGQVIDLGMLRLP